MKNILIVDDEAEIVELLKVYLENHDFYVLEAYDGEKALSLLEKNRVDAMILDIMMPKMNGIELIKKIRRKSNIPVIFLSAKDEDIDKIYGLGLGADDYMTKPFNPLEVVARLKSLIRRIYHYNKDEGVMEKIHIGDLCLEEKNTQVYKKGEILDLTAMEYKLLQFLMKNSNRVFTKKQLYESIWEQNFIGDDNIIMVYISKLREKIEHDSKKPDYLKTIRGLGYRFEGNIQNEG
ncbi:response regulator transcription factor [Marinisporobacter balticus]|uniref:Stage 0 sporulation protein A homolog n=1 Tax=Marinisporobacter balticus TaxID=2018667 RepID=A0A4R2KVP0_9FIRM|nr:response regulator transcription factor [Marinisporobacter balticus]TCO76897.1 DNA-binding response OmpR family regulator [Marinisporobacter balticus]